MLYPYPNVFGGNRRRFVAGPAGYGTVEGSGFCDASLVVYGFTVGGELDPALLGARRVLALHTIAGPATLILAIEGGGLAQNFLTAVIVPGVNGGAAIGTADASTFTSSDSVGNSVWRWYADKVSGVAVDGFAEFL